MAHGLSHTSGRLGGIWPVSVADLLMVGQAVGLAEAEKDRSGFLRHQRHASSPLTQP